MHSKKPVFRTRRLLVRQLSHADLLPYRAVEGNPKVMRFITGRPRTPAECQERLNHIIERYQLEPLSGIWAVVLQENHEYIGTASLFTLPNSPYLQIGYKLKPEAQGRGYATEIAAGLLYHSFFRAGLQKVVAVTHPQNKASQRVLKKLGMRACGFHKAYGMALTYFSLEKQQYLERLHKRG
ncbi:GNAT family N-acetyltransferase [Cesiribacter sp. SM1]|uniref:GNAT family N-acetyltransferase n=1 Tax=Cesiribacter sp. SM1 TaxID=2861196 RepID=UPI001CD23DA1|nr:GNAT family N-acetyltransferase [Cesiribacter sp. SM1]